MSSYKIIPLQMGAYHDYEKSWLLANTCCGQKTEAIISAFLIKGEDKCILVDTGTDSPETAVVRYHEPFERTENMEIVKSLAINGVKPEDISAIIHTHLHWDHCQNDGLFENAKIYVQLKEIKYAIQPLPCQWDEYESAQGGHKYPWLPFMERFEIVDGDLEIFDGIKLIFLPGHSRGFQGVLVNTEKGKELIAGEAMPLYENFLGVNGKRFLPSAVHVNTRDCLDSYKKMAEISDYIWAGNDPEIMNRAVVKVVKGGEEDELAYI